MIVFDPTHIFAVLSNSIKNVNYFFYFFVKLIDSVLSPWTLAKIKSAIVIKRELDNKWSRETELWNDRSTICHLCRISISISLYSIIFFSQRKYFSLFFLALHNASVIERQVIFLLYIGNIIPAKELNSASWSVICKIKLISGNKIIRKLFTTFLVKWCCFFFIFLFSCCDKQTFQRNGLIYALIEMRSLKERQIRQVHTRSLEVTGNARCLMLCDIYE